MTQTNAPARQHVSGNRTGRYGSTAVAGTSYASAMRPFRTPYASTASTGLPFGLDDAF